MFIKDDECIDSSVCQYDLHSKMVELAHFNEKPLIQNEVNGFFAAFQSGHTIVNPFTKKECNVSFLFEFDCNKNANWSSDDVQGQAPTPTNFTGITKDSCQVSRFSKT